jgi:ABC-2 type transport system permease protein
MMSSATYLWNNLVAEFARRFWTMIRYPVDYFTGVVSLYLLFIGLFYGVSGHFDAGAPGLSRTLDGLVLGTCMWFFAISIMNQVRVILEMEAVTGTLEQLFLAPVRFVTVLFIRSFSGFVYSVIAVVILLLLIMATTGRWLSFPFWPTALVFVLTALGIHGLALVMGGLSLVFKRLGQLNMIVQFGFIFLAYPPIESLSPAWQKVAYSFPLARGMTILRGLVVDGWSITGAEFGMNIVSLIANSAVYFLIGWAAYLLCERVAKEFGLLGHY